MRFLIFLLLGAVGIGMILKTGPLVDFTGRIGWAEQHLGATGTYTLYKLIGLGLIIIGTMYATGLFQSLVNGFFGFLIPGSEPANR